MSVIGTRFRVRNPGKVSIRRLVQTAVSGGAFHSGSLFCAPIQPTVARHIPLCRDKRLAQFTFPWGAFSTPAPASSAEVNLSSRRSVQQALPASLAKFNCVS